MSREQEEGFVEHKPLIKIDFDKLSQTREVVELKELVMAMENGDKAVEFFVKSEETTYQTTHVLNAIPVVNPRTMTMADLVYHQI